MYIYGKHPLTEALKNGAEKGFIENVYLTKDRSADPVVVSLLQKFKIPSTVVTEAEIEHMVGRDVVHQGVCAKLDEGSLYQELDEVLVEKENKLPCLVLLDELEDPHNVGAIIRSASAFGATAVLFPLHGQVKITSTVVKSSSGTVFSIPLVRIGNVNTTIRELKEKGFWIYGLTGKGESSLPNTVFDAKTVIIIGSEGSGIREKTEELCDFKLSIPIDERCESLNASNAVAVTLYEWSKQQLIK